MKLSKFLKSSGVLLFSIAAVSTALSAAPLNDRITIRSQAPLPASLQELRLQEPLSLSDTGLAEELRGATGTQLVLIRLKEPSIGKAKKMNLLTDAATQKFKVKTQQERYESRIMYKAKSFKVKAKTYRVLNGIFAEVDAKDLAMLASDPDVLSINKVRDYEMDLSETVPYIGATDVQNVGITGSGISVAVLDSGIDYYHADLGGSGDPADYAADDPTIIEPGSFPTAKVVGGFDFVGSNWSPNGAPLAPDADPLDDGPAAGHGSHVADIIGGSSGVAPGVDLYAVKVCSSVSSSCSGIGLIQGMEFVVDPNGDGNFADHVDIVNMSLGSNYGQSFDDDLAAAVDNATSLGVLTVASAGNGSDKPYITGTPAAAATALSVAQTTVPSAFQSLLEVTAPADIAGVYQAVFQSWSVTPDMLEAPLVYSDGTTNNLNACTPYPANTFAGEIVLVDRGGCNFTLKALHVQNGGGSVAIIGLIAPGAPFNGGDGGDGPITIPAYMISQNDSNALKSGLPDTVVRLDLDLKLSTVGSMVGSSSRGPRNPDSLLKPEIGAPGASVSAEAGTGTETTPFGGTSGAAPMVAGSAALVLEVYPGLSPASVKARLMNTGETTIFESVSVDATPLAPVSRIGGGEVRVDQAIAASVVAWDKDTENGALSLGFVDIDKETKTIKRKVRLQNYSDHDVTFAITPTFRFADDEASEAVAVEVDETVTVKAGGHKDISVKFKFTGANLPGNFMNSGSQATNSSALTLNEYDGYLNFEAGADSIHMAWHVLPRQAAKVSPEKTELKFMDGLAEVALSNKGVGIAQNDAYALIAVSKNQPEGSFGGQSPTPDIRAVGVNTFPVPAGFCSANDSFIWAFAINTWERQSHLLPVSHFVNLDTNQDGADDFIVLNRDLSGLGTISDGRQVTYAFDLNTGTSSAFFFAEHSTNTGNTVLLVCAEQIGLSRSDLLNTNVDVSVFAQDFYFGGPGDLIENLTITPLGERYFATPTDIAAGADSTMSVLDFGAFPGNSDELGVMLITNGDRGTGAHGGATQKTEALLFKAE